VNIVEWKELTTRVNDWARVNAPSCFNYGSRYSYWANAKHEGICTEEEFNYAAEIFGDLWHYRGD